MKDITLVRIGLFIFIIVSLLVIGFVENSPKKIEQVKCYDRFINEIEGVSCKEEIYDNKIINVVNENLMFLVILDAIAMAFLIISFIDGDDKK